VDRLDHLFDSHEPIVSQVLLSLPTHRYHIRNGTATTAEDTMQDAIGAAVVIVVLWLVIKLAFGECRSQWMGL
jgi:hypothetical protein